MARDYSLNPSLEDFLKNNPTQLPEPNAVRSILRVGRAGGPLALTHNQIWNYLLLGHPAMMPDFLEHDIDLKALGKRLKQRVSRGVQVLRAAKEVEVRRLRLSYATGGLKYVFWSDEHNEIPDCFDRILTGWESIRCEEADLQIVALTENVSTIEALIKTNDFHALMAELVVADAQIGAAANSNHPWAYGGMRLCERMSRWIGDGSYLAISRDQFGACDDTFVTCVPSLGDRPRGSSPAAKEKLLDSLRQLLDETRAAGHKLCIHVPAPPPKLITEKLPLPKRRRRRL